MKTHYARYTPEMVERVCGTPKQKFLQVCEMIGSTSTPTRAMTIMYALGWTQHSVGAQMIRCGAMVQLLLGNIVCPRWHERAARTFQLQGSRTWGSCRTCCPVHHAAGREEQDYGSMWAARAFNPCGQIS